MRYINTTNKQIIIKTAISTSKTKTTSKDNKEVFNTKYIAYLPIDVLILLLEQKFKTIPETANLDDAISWINNIIAEKNIYLRFAIVPGASDNTYDIDIVDEKNDNCIAIRKQLKSDSYYFTVSKRLFKLLKNSDKDNFYLKYCISFDNGVIDLDNFVVNVELL